MMKLAVKFKFEYYVAINKLIAGQVIAYEIMQSTLVGCPLEMHKIPVPCCDAVFDAQCMGKTEIPFIRAKYDKNTGHGFNVPREQVSCLFFLIFGNLRINKKFFFSLQLS